MEKVVGFYQQRQPPFMETTRKSKVWQLKTSYRLNLIPSAPQLAATSTNTRGLISAMISTTMFQTSERIVISLILSTLWIQLKINMVENGTSALHNPKNSGTTQPKIPCMTSAQCWMKTLGPQRNIFLMLRQLLITSGSLKIYN